MIDEADAHRRMNEALLAGGRFYEDQWSRHVRAAKEIAEKLNDYAIDLTSAPERPAPSKSLEPKYVPGDRVAVPARELLGVEVELNELRQQISRIDRAYNSMVEFRNQARDAATLVSDLELDRLHEASIRTSDPLLSMVAFLVQEVRHYRRAFHMPNRYSVGVDMAAPGTERTAIYMHCSVCEESCEGHTNTQFKRDHTACKKPEQT